MKKRKIYSLPANLTPEVRAVTFAKCSRSPESFQEIANELTEEKSSEFHEKWVVGYGHSSVAEHAFVSMALENVSILATKVIEDARLASYTEKSTRYQVFTKDSVYRPDNLGEFTELYNQTVDLLMDTYEKMAEPMDNFIKEKYPQKDESDSLYKMVCRSRSCDNIRYLLPTATLTNLGLTSNARELEHLIKKLLSHPLPEMQEIGQEIKQEALKEVPTLVRFAEANPYIQETKKSLNSIAKEKDLQQAGNNQPVTIVDYDKNAEDKLIAAILYPYSQLSFKEISEKLSEEDKDRIIDEALQRRSKYDAPLREFEHIYYTFEILIDYGAFRDIQRHRMCTQSNQEVTVIHGYDMPPEMKEAGLDKEFQTAVEKAMEAYNIIYPHFPQEAQYLVPLCFRKRVLFTWNLRELFHFISLRSGQKGHPSYRRVAQECWRQLNAIHPRLAKYIAVDMEEMSASWAATLENKDYYFNPWAARKNI